MCRPKKNQTVEFSSLIKTVVGDAVIPPFKINGPNGYCADAVSWVDLLLVGCDGYQPSRIFTFNDDGTIRINGKCLTARGLTEGSVVKPDTCNNPDKNAITWQVSITDRQIKHPYSGLVLSAISGKFDTPYTLEHNVFSSFQTFRLDTQAPVLTAGNITGMNGLCLLTSPNNDVWLGACGSSGSWQKWLIYPDGTVRPQQRSNGCLSYENLTSRRVRVTACGLAPTAERWLFARSGTVLNENANMVLDVVGANPSTKTIIVYAPHGGENQKFKINYD